LKDFATKKGPASKRVATKGPDEKCPELKLLQNVWIAFFAISTAKHLL
jgi:hypothetical protein